MASRLRIIRFDQNIRQTTEHSSLLSGAPLRLLSAPRDSNGMRKLPLMQLILPYTVCFFSFVLRNRTAVSLFLDFWGLQWSLSDPKIGRKLLVGQKHNIISFIIVQERDCLKEEFKDLSIWAQFTGCPKNDFFFLFSILSSRGFTTNHFL